LTLREEQRLRVFENRALRRIFRPKRDVTGKWRKMHNEELRDLYSSPSTRCGKLTSFFEMSGLKHRGAPGGWAWSHSREGILKLCDIVVQ
jgi:hypothetical protein